MTIMGVKLVTGQEVFGEFQITPEGRVKLTNPVALRMVPSQLQGGQPSMAIVPFPEMADPSSGPLLIEPLHIVYTFVPFEDFVAEYKAIGQGGSGDKQIITG